MSDPTKPRYVQLREQRNEVRDDLNSFLRARTFDELSAGEQEHVRRVQRHDERLTAEMVELEDKQAQRDGILSRSTRSVSGIPEPAGMPAHLAGDVQERALRSLEAVASEFRGAGAIDTQDALIRKDPVYAADFEVRSRPEYLQAFGRILRAGSVGDAGVFMSDGERQAMADMAQCRAMAEGATTQGGFAVPVVIDPSVILTDQENDNPFLRLARIENVTSNTWKGVSAAGATWSFDSEAAEVSDDSITIAQPSVTVFTARGFIPYSIEVGEDWPGFNAEMARVLSAGYDDLLLQKLTLGSGNGEPHGIVTALDATAASESLVTTSGAIGDVDVYNAWASLPAKYHQRASWMASVGVVNEVRQFGQTNMYHASTVNLAAGSVEVLLGRQMYENAYMTAYTGTTGHYNYAIVGDFSNYVIARRTGLSVELVPHLFATGANRPSGQRGLFAYARIGGAVVNSAAFKLINQT